MVGVVVRVRSRVCAREQTPCARARAVVGVHAYAYARARVCHSELGAAAPRV
jgi:hypothetical protein